MKAILILSVSVIEAGKGQHVEQDSQATSWKGVRRMGNKDKGKEKKNKKPKTAVKK